MPRTPDDSAPPGADAIPSTWLELDGRWSALLPEPQFALIRALRKWFDDAWVAENSAAILRDGTAHQLYRWLAAPMLVGQGGETRLLSLAESLSALSASAPGTPWEGKLPLLVRRLKSYSSDAHEAFFDVEFEVLQLGRALTTSDGAILRDLEQASGNGASVDAVVSLGDRQCYVEFKALERSEEAQSFDERTFEIVARMRVAIGSDTNWEVNWCGVPSPDDVELLARFVEEERDRLRRESVLVHELAKVELRDGTSGMGWRPSPTLSRRRIRKKLKQASRQLGGCRPAVVKLKLAWTDALQEQLDEIGLFLQKSKDIDAVILYEYDAFTPTGCILSGTCTLSEAEIRRLA